METYSDLSQDAVALLLLGKNNYYLDIGCGDYMDRNNTRLLEENGWRGILIDKDSFNYSSNPRKNSSIYVADCTDKDSILNILEKENAPKTIDYISLDIDQHSLDALYALPLDKYRFKFLTFEHDLYADPSHPFHVNHPHGEWRKCLLRKIEAPKYLEKFGYVRVGDSLLLNGGPVEDWFVDPSQFDMDIFKDVINRKDIDHKEYYNLLLDNIK